MGSTDMGSMDMGSKMGSNSRRLLDNHNHESVGSDMNMGSTMGSSMSSDDISHGYCISEEAQSNHYLMLFDML